MDSDMITSIFSLIEEINYQWIKDADSYANESGDRWGWFTSIEEVSFSLPFHRTMMGADHTYFVIDLDPEMMSHPSHPDIIDLKERDPILYRELLIRGMIEFTEKLVESLSPHEFFVKLSGTGIHLMQRVGERIDKRRFKAVIRDIFKPCSESVDKDEDEDEDEEEHICVSTCDGWNNPMRWDDVRKIWVKNPHQWARIYHTSFGMIMSIGIDLSVFSTRRHMIRWVYSINRKIPQKPNYSIPIDIWDADWVIEHMTRRGLETHPPHLYEIPPFSFYGSLSPEEEMIEDEEYTKVYPTSRDLSYKITVPDVDDELTTQQLSLIDDMRKVLNGDVKTTPPCIQEHYNRVMTLAGQHWPRVALVRYLAAKGYTPNNIALFFRFHVNDEDDNLSHNKHKLISGVKESYGPLQDPDMPPGCKKMQSHEYFGVIDDPHLCMICGRKYPLSKYKEIGGVQEGEDRGFNTIMTLCRNILMGGESSVIKKSTRAGVTTSIIAMSKLVGKKILVITPTNKIGESTIPNALKIAKETLGIDVRGAMFAANKRACLKLVLINRDLQYRKNNDPKWGDDDTRIAYDKLHYNNRPRCEDCSFNEKCFDTLRFHGNDFNSFPIPILYAEPTNWQPGDDVKDGDGLCAYATIKQYLEEIDVMFTTYSKLTALMMNTTEDAQTISDVMFEHFDVILLDEVSYLTNQSPNVLPILQRQASGISSAETYRVNIFDDIDNETFRLDTLLSTRTSDEAIRILKQFRISQVDILNNPPMTYGTTVIENNPGTIIDNDSMDTLKTHFAAFHHLIEHAAKTENIHLEKTEDILHLLNSERWIRVSLPTQFNPVDITIIAEPDVSYLRRFLRVFEKTEGKQLLVTDATLPYVDVSDFLGIDFVDAMVGDPRGTNEQQLVIADSRRLSVIDLFFGQRAPGVQRDMLNFINMVCKEHDADNVIIIVPNIWTHIQLRSFMRDNKIPRCDMTWYRSDLTIGVECDKRIMICITAPHPPKGSHDWLATWYHEQGILRGEEVPVLGKHLSDNSTKAAFYQAIGRAKDPTCKEKSVVYLFGIPAVRTLEEGTNLGAGDLMMFDDDIPIPHISMVPRESARTELVTLMGRAWIKDKTLLTLDEIRIFNKVLQNGVFDTRKTTRRFSFYTREQVEKVITDRINESSHDLFNMFNIDVTPIFKPPNGPWYYILKRRTQHAIHGTQ